MFNLAVEKYCLLYTMDIAKGTKINKLLACTHPSGLLFSEWLRRQGYSDQLQKRYRDTGWLTSLCKGVMYRSGSKLSAYASLASSNEQQGTTYRVAAHSALERAGFNHFVPMGKPVLSVALPAGNKRPAWMKNEEFDMTFYPFTTDTFEYPEVDTYKEYGGTLLVSSPEQAFLECLLLAPKQYSYLDLYYIMEQLVTLRSDVVQRLLETTANFRIKRVFLYMAEKAGHYWYEELDSCRIETGTSKLQLEPNGIYNVKYKMTIPKELETYEG